MPGENEPPEALVRRFKRAVYASGVIEDVKKKRYHMTTQDIKKYKEAQPKKPSVKPRSLADAEKDTTMRGGAVPSSRSPNAIPRAQK